MQLVAFGLVDGYNGFTHMTNEQAHKLVDQMPMSATWDDLMRAIYVRLTIEQGLTDSQEARAKPIEEVRAEFGLPE